MSNVVRALGLALVLALAGGSTSVALAQVPPAQCNPRVSLDAARRIAILRVNGHIRHEELASDGRRWIYVFEIIAGNYGVEIVNVDADTGLVVGVAHDVR